MIFLLEKKNNINAELCWVLIVYNLKYRFILISEKAPDLRLAFETWETV